MILVVFGVSNFLGDILDCAHALGHRVTKVVMNQPEVLRERTKGVAERLAMLPEPPAIVALDDYRPGDGEIHCLGTTSPRRGDLVALLDQRFGLTMTTLGHPAAWVSPFATIGRGVFIGAGTVVAPGAVLGDHVILNRAVSVGHDTVVEAYARLQPGCNVGGHVRIGAGCTIGMGATVIEELVIGAGSIVAAGAVVLRDVEAGVMVAGVPAVIKKR